MTALHLLRHADAGNPARWAGPDAARPLSAKGRRQAGRLGRLLAASDAGPDVLVTSPKARAAETAALVADALGIPVIVDDRLAGPVDLGTVEAILFAAGDAARPCLVGHDPDFSELLGTLLGTDRVAMRKGALARVDLERPIAPGGGTLRYLLTPDVLPRHEPG